VTNASRVRLTNATEGDALGSATCVFFSAVKPSEEMELT
jgi:hypothetical protein